MKLLGREYSKEEILRYTELQPVKEFEYTAGKGKGVGGYLVTTGGLSFTVLKDRGLDIADAAFGGVPLTFNCKNGQTAPTVPFLEGFFGGLLTTCGLLNVGPKCVENGREYTMHGDYNHTPAHDIGVRTDWVGDALETSISGKVSTASLFGEHLVMHRTIKTRYGEDKIEIRDVLENRGFLPAEYMLLYHINFGFPFFDKGAKLTLNTKRVEDLNGYSDITRFSEFDAPVPGFREEVFAHYAEGPIIARLQNIGIFGEIACEGLPYLIQWKQQGAGDYALGLEPSTNKPKGRLAAREAGELRVLQPMETAEVKLALTFGSV